MKFLFYLLRALLQAVYALHPLLGNKLAFQLFTRPLFQVKKKEEILFLETAEKEKFSFEGECIQIYRFGCGPVPILLVHGWRGHAGNFEKIVSYFDLKHFQFIAFDAPAHHASTGSQTNVFQIARLCSAIIEQYHPHYIIAHSMGSAAVVTALRDTSSHQVKRVVLLSTPNKLSLPVQSFTKEFGFSDSQRDSFLDYIERKLNRTFEESKIQHQIRELKIPILLLHDKQDRILPIEEAYEVASANKDTIEMVVLEKTGHYRMLSAPQAIEKIKSFIYGKRI